MRPIPIESRVPWPIKIGEKSENQRIQIVKFCFVKVVFITFIVCPDKRGLGSGPLQWNGRRQSSRSEAAKGIKDKNMIFFGRN